MVAQAVTVGSGDIARLQPANDHGRSPFEIADDRKVGAATFRTKVWHHGEHRNRLGAAGHPQQRGEQKSHKDFLHILAAVRTQLDEAAFAVAWTEGQTMPLAQAIPYVLAMDNGIG